MASININEINGIEGINIGGTAILCSSNPNCILKFDYKDNQNCKVSKVGNILSIDFPNSDNKIEALKNTWILKKILVRGPPKIFNTFNNNAIINNSLQFDFVHSLENKKAKANTYVIVSIVAQVNDIYSNTTTFNAVNRINIPSSANNNQATDLNISPSDFFPENENPFYQYNIPKTTNVNQIYINTIRSISPEFFNNFNNRVLGGNYELLFNNNYVKISQSPVSPNPIFFNQNTAFQPLGNIEECRSGCRAPNGKIIGPDMNNNENQNSGTGGVIPTGSTLEPLDAENENLPAKCFQKQDQSQTSTGTGTSTGNDTQEEEVKCTTMVKVGGKNLSTTQMITTCIFAAVIAVGVTFIIWKMGKNGNNVNSNSNWVNISIFTSWIGIFIIFLAYYIALNGRKWDTYKENEEAAKKKRDAYSGFTWATLFISMIILSCVAFYYVFSNKFNLPSFVKNMFKYAPIIILIAISITAIVLGVKSYGETCKQTKDGDNKKDSGEKSSTKRKNRFNLVIIMLFIAISLFGPELLILKNLKALSKPWKIGIGIIIALWVIFLILLVIFATITNSLLHKYNTDLPDDPDCRTQEQKDEVRKLQKYLQTELILLFAFIIQIFVFTLVLLSFWKNFRFSTLVAIFAGLMIIFQILFIVIVKTRKYKDGKTLPQKCEKIDVDLNPLLITMGCMIGVWIIVIIAIFVFRKKESTFAFNAINSSNLSDSNKKLLRNAVGDGLFTTQSNRNQAVDILKSNPALAKSLANQGYTLDKIQNPKLADAFSSQEIPMKTLNSGVSKKTGILNVNTFNRKLDKSSLPKNDQNFLKKLVSEPNPSQMDLNRVGGILAKDSSLKTYLDNKGIDLSKGVPARIPSLSTSAVTY
jgi:MFS family permease/carbonic anhydrase